MAILIDKNTRVLVQGITGRSGRLQTQTLIEYGTRVVAGVTPGKGGMVVHNVPVFNFIDEVCLNHEVDAVISFVPPMVAKDAAFEVIDNGIPLLVLTMEGVPQKDVVEILSYASGHNTRVIGPGAAGIIAPGKCKLGAHPSRMFKEGHVGIVSKSGALSYEMGKRLTEAGIGQSTVVALGGGPIWGTNQREIVELFQKDPETSVILLLGEIGGATEIKAAEYIADHVTKPVVSLIVGRHAPAGKSLGHAGAIIIGNKGTAVSKMKVLTEAGVHMARNPREVIEAISELLEVNFNEYIH